MRAPPSFTRYALAFLSIASACTTENINPVPLPPSPKGFTFAPQGCAYPVSMDLTRGSDFRPDDATLGADPLPKRMRLGLGGGTTLGASDYADPSRTTALVWDTDPRTLATRVRFGAAPDALSAEQAGMSYLLPGDVPMRIHRADLCGLSPETTYYYQVGGGPPDAEIWSEVKSFTTQPSPAAGATVSIGVSGDSRDSIDVVWPLLQKRMATAGIDFQIFTGDSIALAIPTSEALYAQWFDGAAAGGVLGSMPLFAIGGNHENVGSIWLSNHALPGSGLSQSLFASFDAGPAHVVLFDDQLVAIPGGTTEIPVNVAEGIAAWLEADLAAANARRDVVPWIVVVNHRGVLSTSDHGQDDDVRLVRSMVMPLFDEHHVDLVLSGHDHDYERSTPATGPASAPAVAADPSAGTVYVVSGGAGAEPYPPGVAPVPYRAANAGFGAGTPHVGAYGVLTLAAKTLTWKAYGLTAAGSSVADDDVIDEISWSK